MTRRKFAKATVQLIRRLLYSSASIYFVGAFTSKKYGSMAAGAKVWHQKTHFCSFSPCGGQTAGSPCSTEGAVCVNGPSFNGPAGPMSPINCPILHCSVSAGTPVPYP